MLVWSFIRKRQTAIHRHVKTIPDDVMEMLKRYSWPGNIRELENVIERALIHSTGDTLSLLDWDPEAQEIQPSGGGGATLMSVERAHIQQVLRECGWRINGLGDAAERLGLHPNTLRFRMKKLGIVRSESSRPRRLSAADSPRENTRPERHRLSFVSPPCDATGRVFRPGGLSRLTVGCD